MFDYLVHSRPKHIHLTVIKYTINPYTPQGNHAIYECGCNYSHAVSNLHILSDYSYCRFKLMHILSCTDNYFETYLNTPSFKGMF